MKKTMLVSDSDAGSLIGRGGSVIKGLMSDSGCHIQFQQKTDNPGASQREVYLSGTPEQIAKAEELIRELTSRSISSQFPSGPPRPVGGYPGSYPPPPSSYGA